MAQKILIAEQDSVRGATLAMILNQLGGFETKLVTTIQAAISEVSRVEYDLLITDTTFQKQGDGINLAKILLLKMASKAPQILAISDEVDRSTVDRCQRVGVLDYIVHPYDPPDMLARVEKAISARKGVEGNVIDIHVREVLNEVVDIPTISPVYAKLAEIEKEEGTEASADTLEGLLRLDPAVTAKLLKIANSSLFQFNRPITTLHDAVSLLGFQAVKNVVLTVTVFDTLTDCPEIEDFPRMAFWEHSVGTGAIARWIAGRLDQDPETAMVAGMLHDIGKVVFSYSFADRFRETLMVGRLKKVAIVDAEAMVMGVTHAAAGRYMAEQWGLPAPFPAVVGHHHDLQASEEELPMVHLVHLADYLAKVLNVGSAGDACPPQLNPDVPMALNTELGTIEGWTGELGEFVQESLAALRGDQAGTPPASASEPSEDDPPKEEET